MWSGFGPNYTGIGLREETHKVQEAPFYRWTELSLWHSWLLEQEWPAHLSVSLVYLSISWLKMSCWKDTLLHGQKLIPTPWRVTLMWLQESKKTTNELKQAMLSFPSCNWADKLAEYFMLDASQLQPQSSEFYKPNHKQKPNLGMQNSLRNPKEKYQLSILSQRSWEERLNKEVL